MFKWANLEISSPDGKITVFLQLKNGVPFYRVAKNDETIIYDSKLGFNFYGIKFEKQHFSQPKTRSHRENIQLNWGETRKITNNYNEITVQLEKYNLIFRVFDHAVAFRYVIRAEAHLTRVSVADELTEFSIDPSATSWSIPAYEKDRYEYNYKKSELISLTHAVHTPLTIETQHHFLSIHEAALYQSPWIFWTTMRDIMRRFIKTAKMRTIKPIRFRISSTPRLSLKKTHFKFT